MLWIVFLLLFGSQTEAFAAVVDNLRVWHAPDQSRLVFDLSEAVKFDVFTVRNPDRLVVDLSGTSAAHPLALPTSATERVIGLRFAPRAGQNFRVVFDLAHAVEIRKALLPPHAPYGHRLVIDLLDRKLNVATRQPPPRDLIASANPPPATVTAAASMHPPVVDATAKVDPPATDSASESRAPSRELVIAVDAGHGGEDVGAIGPRGIYEKTVVLAIARELVDLLNAEPGLRGVLTRDGDYYVELRDRMVRAREKKADLFVSIHADAFRNRQVRGASVYVLSPRGATNEAARWLAERENAADLVGGVTLDDKDNQLRSVLLDLSQNASMEASHEAASKVLRALHRVGEVHHEQVQAAGFMVLKSPDIPSILVETAFISNPTEEQHLGSVEFRHNLAVAIRDGIKAYFQAAPRGPSQRLAQSRIHRVAVGDTLSGIAEQYAVSRRQILLANSRSDDTVRLGEVLRIP